MAKYFKLIFYADGDEYETHESILTEAQMRGVQKAVAEGKKFLMLENKIIRTQSIKELLPADDIVAEYNRLGITPKQLGVSESPMLESGEVDEAGRKKYEAMRDKSFSKSELKS